MSPGIPSSSAPGDTLSLSASALVSCLLRLPVSCSPSDVSCLLWLLSVFSQSFCLLVSPSLGLLASSLPVSLTPSFSVLCLPWLPDSLSVCLPLAPCLTISVCSQFPRVYLSDSSLFWDCSSISSTVETRFS